MNTAKEDEHKPRRLMLLFMFTYLISYLTRINYATVISEIVIREGVLKSTASLALSCSALTYGVGQLLSGYMGDKIQPKKIIFTGFVITIFMNLLIPLCSNPHQMAVVWSINGLAQAFMWPPLVKLMINVFSKEDYKRAVVVVSWGGSLGKILVYLVAPILIYWSGWRSVFIFSATAAVVMAVVWMLTCPKIAIAAESKNVQEEKSAFQEQFTFSWLFMIIGILLAIVLHGALRDGITTWMPSMIAETFHLSSNISILTGVLFPLFGIIMSSIVSIIYRKVVRNELALSSLLFCLGAVSALFLALFNDIHTALTVILSVFLIGSMNGVNQMLVCIIPAHFDRYGRTSLISGIFNSVTYLGSSISTYGIAAYTERFGWSSMVLLCSLVALAGGFICFIISKKWWRWLTRADNTKPVDKISGKCC